MRTFSHPNVVEMFSSYIVNDELWVVMEYMDCGALTTVLSHTRCVLMAVPDLQFEQFARY